jgi:hypothetical protein
MRIWIFNCRRDVNRFRDMMAAIGVATSCCTVGMQLFVMEVAR